MKKRLLSALLATALFVSLTACGGGSASSGAASSAPAASGSAASAPAGPDDVDLKELAANYDGEIKVEIWGKDSIGEDESSRGFLINKLAQEYASQFDNVTIDYIHQGSYSEVAEKVMAAAAAQTLPAMFMTEEAMVKGFAAIAADMREYVPSATLDNYMQGLLVSMYDENGRLLAAPYARSLPVLYANEQLLAEAGWKIEDIKTNDDMFAAAKDVKDKTGAYGYCLFWDSDAWHWESAIYADGGAVLTEDGSAPSFGKDYDYVGAKFVNRIKEGLLEGYIVSPYGTPKPGDTRDDMLSKGEVAMTLTSCNSMPQRANKMAENGYTLVTTIQPQGEGGYSVTSGGSNWVICESASYEQKMIAGGFLDFLASDENILSMTVNCGNMMITEGALASEGGQQLLEEKPYFQAVYDSTPYLHARPNTSFWTEMYIYATDKLEQFSLNPATTDVEAMVDDIETKFQQIIDDNTW